VHGFWVSRSSGRRQRKLVLVNAGKLMTPASSLKVVTLAAAAETLGWTIATDATLRTVRRAAAFCRRPDRRRSGDSNLDDWDGIATNVFAGWAEQLKAAGIAAIDGRVIAMTTHSTTRSSDLVGR